jgi:hypothetical protein
VPAEWAGSGQSNRHAVGMPSLLNGLFIEQIRELFLGSGPRDRGFESPSRSLTHEFTERPQSRARPANPKSARIDSGQRNGALKKFEERIAGSKWSRALLRLATWAAMAATVCGFLGAIPHCQKLDRRKNPSVSLQS